MRVSNTLWMAGLFVSGCAVSHDVGEETSSLSSGIELTSSCQQEVTAAFDGLPLHLACTGLYTEIADKTLADGREQFTPAYPLWSDASVKTRWLYLPAGEQIDASNPKAWTFPNGTRFWKEFRNPSGDKRIETRIFSKQANGEWARATYEWSDDENDATRVADAGKDITVDGKPYHLPSRTECDDCHKGRRDRVMGFDQVSLGLPEAMGLSVSDLVAQDRIANLTGPMALQIGAGGGPDNVEAKALGWMHSNCGVSCHNDTPTAKAYSNGMRLMLDPTELDGRDTADFAAIKTTVNQAVNALQWSGKTRVVPGAPEQSWLYTLISQRGNPKEQMPPLASNEVDTVNTEVVKQWIVSLGDPDRGTTSK
jgi:hypothetical protein